MTPEIFQRILRQLEPEWRDYNYRRLYHEDRKRKVGEGTQFTLTLSGRLLLVLMYYRVYVPQGFLGALFGLDDSAVSRNIRMIQPLLARLFKVPERQVKMTEEELWEIWIDATEQPIERPKKQNGKWYSGKKKGTP